MEVSIWTYPWDVQDVGVEGALADLLDRAGAGGVSLAVAYHAGRFVQPRSPRRKVYFPEDGTIYFEPSRAHYGRIQPQVAEIVRERGDVLAELARAREQKGFRLNAWTVCLHNTRIGMAYPDVAVQNAFGDRYFHSLCPSHPDARHYLCALVGDLTRRYQPDSVELESPGFMGFGHGYHHEKDEVGLSPTEQYLLSLCFCPHCTAQARRAGVAADAARAVVERSIVQAFGRAVPDAEPLPAGPDGFAPALAEYLRWRSEPVTALIGAIKAAADQATRVYCLTGAPHRAWLSGYDLPAIGRLVDGFVLLAYDQEAPAVQQTVAAVRPLGGFLSAGLRLAGIADGRALADRAGAARRAGADGVHLYNYGLVPAARLDWVRHLKEGS